MYPIHRSIQLLLSTERIGVFSGYLFIDNLTNPIDCKYVRVSIEVVMAHASALEVCVCVCVCVCVLSVLAIRSSLSLPVSKDVPCVSS